ncbi:membrane-spanning 4-domains subfamily A member 6C-like [Hoplias malabaricus]|uniref:membrane-spanning 4-domains subfamily A member 6C-like n=1 Tax=Hoplias malabaricus TaxID=27720 RepID=UPI003462B4CA
MASSFVPNSNIKSGFTVMTQVVPGGLGQTGDRVSTPGPVQKILKREKQALGTAQIVIGIMTLLFGIMSTVRLEIPFVTSGVTLWGPAIFIISGVLSIVAEIKAHPSLVTVSLVMNVISSVIAGVAIVLLSTSLIIFHPEYLCHDISYREPYHRGEYDTEQECKSLQRVLRMATSFLPVSSTKKQLHHCDPGGPRCTRADWRQRFNPSPCPETSERRALGVTVSLVMNVISSVIAGVAIVLLSTSLIIFHPEYLCHDISYREPYHRGEYDTEQECKSLQVCISLRKAKHEVLPA